MNDTPGQDVKNDEQKSPISAKDYLDEIALAKKEREKFEEQGDKVFDRYLDVHDGSTDTLGRRNINLFWANIGILRSSLYANAPKPIVKREFNDFEDDVARVAGEIMERLLSTEKGESQDMHEALMYAIDDRLLPGLGQVWMRYEAKTEEMDIEGISYEQLVDENVACDYVQWKDFFWSPARTWKEVRWVARRSWMPYPKLVKRFGEDKAKVIPRYRFQGKKKVAHTGPEHINKTFGEIFEIWDKHSRWVCWVADGCEVMLDKKTDPLQLKQFFPCPQPIVANLTTANFMPKSDYTMVQDQYNQLNELNNRLSLLQNACKVVGVYNKTAEGVQRMLKEGVENDLIPVDNWAMFAEQGGIKGVIDWMPIEAIVIVIEKLTEFRAEVVQQLYELTGLSDIMRGVTNPRETAKAQTLKAQYSSARLQYMQGEVSLFVKRAMDIKAEIITNHFSAETIFRKSLIEYTPDAPYAEQAIALLKDQWQSCYRLEISTDQLSIPDYNAEKETRVSFIAAMGQFISQVTPLVETTPEAAPFMLKLLQWAAVPFKASGGAETLFDQYIKAVEQKLKTPQPEKPDPLMVQAQAQAKAIEIVTGAEVQAKKAKTGAEVQAITAKAGAQVRATQMKAAGQAGKDATEVDVKQQKARQENVLRLVKSITDNSVKLDNAKVSQEAKRIAAKKKDG